MDVAALALAVDVASALLAAVVTAFFLRSRRMLPRESLGVLGGAFAFFALGYAATFLGWVGLLNADAQETLRILGSSGGGLLILAAYVFRWLRMPASTMTVVAFVVGGSIALAVAYFGLSHEAAFPTQVFPYVRLVDALVLLASASLSTIGVQATRLADLRVPFAYTALALSRYSAAISYFDGLSGPSLGSYLWRLVGLLLLAVTAVARWPRAPP